MRTTRRAYAGASLMLIGAIAGLSVFDFHASRGDEPLFGHSLVD
jgi:hypothetical protein